jgi:hypothetical protein
MIDEPVAPPRSRGRRIEVVTGAFFLVLLVGGVMAIPPLRDTVTEKVRATWDDTFPVTWAGYYLEIDQTDPSAKDDPEQAASQLMFASGALPGSVARLLEEHVYSGTWSPSGERFVVSSGTRLFVGDRHGQVRLLADLGRLLPTAPALWVGDRELVVSTTPDGQRQLLVHLDPRSGQTLDEREMPAGIQPYAPSPDGRWLLAYQQRGGTSVLFEPASGKVVAPKSGEAYAAWLGDGRILVSVLDREGAHLVARKPEGGDDHVLADLDGIPLLPATSNGGRVAIVEQQTLEVSGPRTIWLIAPGEAPQRVARDLSGVYLPKVSRDGRYVSFSEVSTRTGALRIRTGVIEVASKRTSYACDEGCAILDLR